MNLIHTLRSLGCFSRSLVRKSSSQDAQFACLSDLNKKGKFYEQDKRKTTIMPGKKNQMFHEMLMKSPSCVIQYFHSNKDCNHSWRVTLRRCLAVICLGRYNTS
jgi:predicted metal-dependent peptidase